MRCAVRCAVHDAVPLGGRDLSEQQAGGHALDRRLQQRHRTHHVEAQALVESVPAHGRRGRGVRYAAACVPRAHMPRARAGTYRGDMGGRWGGYAAGSGRERGLWAVGCGLWAVGCGRRAAGGGRQAAGAAYSLAIRCLRVSLSRRPCRVKSCRPCTMPPSVQLAPAMTMVPSASGRTPRRTTERLPGARVSSCSSSSRLAGAPAATTPPPSGGAPASAALPVAAAGVCVHASLSALSCRGTCIGLSTSTST